MSPPTRKAIIAAASVMLAGMVLSPLGSMPLLPPSAAIGVFFAIAIVGCLVGILIARPRFPILSRGLLVCGTLSAIAGGALLALDPSASLRAAAIDTLILSVVSGLLCLHLWEESLTRFREIAISQEMGIIVRIWQGLFAAILVGIIFVPLLWPTISATNPWYHSLRLAPIAAGVAVAVTVLDQGRKRSVHGKPRLAMAWLCFNGQLSLLLGITPFSLGWTIGLLLTLAQCAVAIQWIMAAQNQQAIKAGQMLLSLQSQLDRLRDLAAAPSHSAPIASSPSAAQEPPWVRLLEHDMKKALSRVMLGASYLQRSSAQGEAGPRDDYAAKLVSSSKRLERFHNLFMEFMRYHEDAILPLNLGTLSLLQLVRGVIEDEQVGRSNPVTLELGPPIGGQGTPPEAAMRVYWDRTRIEELLINLIDNAAKYSARSAPIEVRLWQSPADQSVTLAVYDQGRGMSPEVALHAFEAGFRADAAQPGQGLGLAIVKAIAELHGGQVQVNSAPGQGTTVSVTLPIDASATMFST